MRRLLDVERRQRRAIERLYTETLGALANALESRDAGTGAHSARVQRLALELTRAIEPDLARSSASIRRRSARSRTRSSRATPARARTRRACSGSRSS